MHKQKKLFLSVYVDDFKMAGDASQLKDMWARLGKRFDLDPPTPLHKTVYLGNQQVNVEVPDSVIQERSTQIHEILNKHSRLSPKNTERQSKQEETPAATKAHDPQPTVRGVRASSKSSKKAFRTHVEAPCMPTSGGKPPRKATPTSGGTSLPKVKSLAV